MLTWNCTGKETLGIQFQLSWADTMQIHQSRESKTLPLTVNFHSLCVPRGLLLPYLLLLHTSHTPLYTAIFVYLSKKSADAKSHVYLLSVCYSLFQFRFPPGIMACHLKSCLYHFSSCRSAGNKFSPLLFSFCEEVISFSLFKGYCCWP